MSKQPFHNLVGTLQTWGDVATRRTVGRVRRFKEQAVPYKLLRDGLARDAEMDARAQKQWLRRLRHRNRHIRQLAWREFQALSPEARVLLTMRAHRRAADEQASAETTAGFGIVAIVVGVLLAHALAFTLSLLLILGIVMVWHGWTRTNRQQQQAKDLVDACDNIALVPFALLQLAKARSEQKQPRQVFGGRNLRNALVRLLPQVQEADATEWTHLHRQALYQYLRDPFGDVEMTVLLLRALPRVGNEEALQLVRGLTTLPPTPIERLLQGEARTAFEANKAYIEQAAQACLPELEALIARQTQEQSLLRASDGTTLATSEMLLRASTHISETPSEQLLRPGQS